MCNLSVSFGRDTICRWSLLSGVYARGSKRSNTRGECVTCQCLLEETLEVVGPFYLVSMPGEVKDQTQGVNV